MTRKSKRELERAIENLVPDERRHDTEPNLTDEQAAAVRELTLYHGEHYDELPSRGSGDVMLTAAEVEDVLAHMPAEQAERVRTGLEGISA